MFEIIEAIYPSYANSNSHSSDNKGGVSTLSSNPKKGRVGKLRINYVDRPSDALTGGKMCIFNGPGYSE